MSGFDVIVVGAGSAGSVITRRLVDAGADVLLLEAGRADSNPAIHDPARMGELWHGPEDWDYYTVPQEHAASRRLHLPRGKVLGGSHALNAMIWVRGAPEDYDHWATLGNDGWAWHDVLPVYHDIENHFVVSAADRQRGGPLDVTFNEPLHPIQHAIIESAVATGVEYNPDYNSGRLDGVSRQQVTMRGGERLTTWNAYMAEVSDASNLTVRTGARVQRLLVNHGNVTGVEYEVDGKTESASADRVVLATGTIDSPRVLLRSGIGAAPELRDAGIDCVADVPGVGKNLHDHLLAPLIFTTDRDTVQPPVPGRSVTQSHLFARSTPDLDVPDTQPIHFSVPMYEPWMSGPAEGFSLMAGMIAPRSRGSVTLSGPDVTDEVRIDLGALREPADLTSLAASITQCREIAASGPLRDEWGAHELYPGPDVVSAADVREYARNTAITYHHQVGTCKMGVDDMAVVDPKLAVYGIGGLRVADASVMPRITSGNTNAPTVLIGERAAAFLLAEG